MILSEVSVLLEELANRVSGLSTQQERVLRTLAEALAQRPNDELGQLVARLKPKQPARPRLSEPPALSQAAQLWLQKLRQAPVASASSIALDIATDKKILKGDMIAIAQTYLGTSRAFTTKKAAHEAILASTQRRLGEENALAGIRRNAGLQ